MTNPDFSKTTTSNLTSLRPDYAVDSKTTDGSYSQKENKWTNPNADKYYGFYYGIGEYRAAINAFATWTIGLGYTTELVRDKVLLEHVTGWGEDTTKSILWNAICAKKFNGDSYTQIIRDDDGELLNLKTLNPSRMAHIIGEDGILKRYEYTQSNGNIKKLKPNEVLHLCNDRILDEPHGTAVTSAVEWVIEKIQQAREDYARIMHVSSVRIFFVDETDTTRQTKILTQYATAIKNGEVMMLACKPEDAKFQDLVVPPADAWIIWLNYLEDKFYKALGVPKVVLGGTAENTEASAKVGVISYEPVWMRETGDLEDDFFNQVGIRIHINKQPSLMDNMQTDEAKNTGQTKLEYQGSQ